MITFRSDKLVMVMEKQGLTMTIPPDCSAVHMLMMGAIPMVVP